MDEVHARGEPEGSDARRGARRVERFANGGRITGAVALCLLAGVLLLGVLDRDLDYPLWVYPAAAVLAVLVWAAALRPAVRVEGEELVLRNMLDTVRLPLAGVQQLAVGRFLAVRVADKRYVGSGLSRSRREALRDDRTGERVEQMSYGGWAESRLWALADDARAQRGIRRASDEQHALGEQVRRQRAWTEIALLVVFTGLFLVTLLV